MNNVAVVAILVIIVGVGVYIGASALLSQYSVEPGGSNADQYACAPERNMTWAGQPVKFTASLPEGTTYYWSAPDSTASFVASGPLTAQYARAGTKTAYLFYIANNRLYRTSCSILVK